MALPHESRLNDRHTFCPGVDGHLRCTGGPCRAALTQPAKFSIQGIAADAEQSGCGRDIPAEGFKGIFRFGNKAWGSLKFGRDIGLFGQNIILSDMTLLGVGGTSNGGIPYNTTFGMIGHGFQCVGL